MIVKKEKPISYIRMEDVNINNIKNNLNILFFTMLNRIKLNIAKKAPNIRDYIKEDLGLVPSEA